MCVMSVCGESVCVVCTYAYVCVMNVYVCDECGVSVCVLCVHVCVMSVW